VAAEVVQRIFDMARWDGADTAKVLGEDQVGLQPGECLCVQGVKIRVGVQLRADVGVDLGGAHAGCVPACHDNGLLRAGDWRLVALEGDSHQILSQAEGIDNLGR